MDDRTDIVVAGHICLDIIPALPAGAGLADMIVPGRLTAVGPAVTSTGGAVSNTGLALHRLGLPVRLMGKVGDDAIGRTILDLLARRDASLAGGMIVATGQASSYSIVLSPPGADRVFLHCPGANDTFSAHDINYAALAGVRLFHFGYPPIMRRMHADGGGSLASMFTRVRELGATTSLDMAAIDPHSSAALVDWPALLALVLPYVDLFLPSIDEMLVMLGRDGPPVTGRLLGGVAANLLAMGPAVVALKLGDQGLYLRTSSDPRRIARAGLPPSWAGRELLAPCFAVEVAGTTGAGDCTIAGLLAAVVRGMDPGPALTFATAVGACCVEAPDATSGVPTSDRVAARIAAGWPRQPVTLDLAGWEGEDESGLRTGPGDSTARR
ncbi:MAG: 2-dehydro-3-deoxygluconokinase [Phycisphaerae bacterium]|nr:2-dehydro-3-deoxygluconokinase [Phycisphaerae bacterium]